METHVGKKKGKTIGVSSSLLEVHHYWRIVLRDQSLIFCTPTTDTFCRNTIIISKQTLKFFTTVAAAVQRKKTFVPFLLWSPMATGGEGGLPPWNLQWQKINLLVHIFGSGILSIQDPCKHLFAIRSARSRQTPTKIHAQSLLSKKKKKKKKKKKNKPH